MTLAIVSINPDKTVLTQTISKMWELQNKKKVRWGVKQLVVRQSDRLLTSQQLVKGKMITQTSHCKHVDLTQPIVAVQTHTVCVLVHGGLLLLFTSIFQCNPNEVL